MIARPYARKKGAFRGVYHHWDSYPTVLGTTLFALYRGHFERDLHRMLSFLIDEHPAGWSTINNADFSLAPGFTEYETEARLCDGRSYDEWFAVRDTYPEIRRPHCYCHGDCHDSAYTLTSEQGTDCEWAYVFDEKKHIMTIYTDVGRGFAAYHGNTRVPVPHNGWLPVATVDLDGEEPDWSAIEDYETFLDLTSEPSGPLEVLP